MSILKTLIEDRRAKRITQTEIAQHIGISKQLIGRLENGKAIPNMKYIEKYADCLGYEIRLLKK